MPLMFPQLSIHPEVNLPRPWNPNKLGGGPELWAPEASWVLSLVCRQREPLKGL